MGDFVSIYVLKDPHTGEIRYVGKSFDPEIRFYHHIRESQSPKNYRHNWVSSLILKGTEPVMEVVDTVPENEWQSWEAAYIQFYLESGCRLVNGTFGGDGWSKGRKRSIESVERSRRYHVGKPLSSEHKNKISLSKRGSKNAAFGKPAWNRNKPHSLETREKMSKAKIGNKNACKHLPDREKTGA